MKVSELPLAFLFNILVLQCLPSNCVTLPEINGLIDSLQLKYINITTSFEMVEKKTLFNLTKLVFQVGKDKS